MDLRSFVRVVAQHTSGDKAFGTAYRLCNDRFLTAHHVVRGAAEIKVEFDRTDGTLAVLKAEKLWVGEDDLDVALLGCEPEPSHSSVYFHFLAREPLSRRSKWYSQGYAFAAVEGKSVSDSMATLAGEAWPFALNQKFFELIVEGKLGAVSRLEGISGAPVFINERIYGVIKEGPKDTERRLLYATSISHLMAKKDFVAMLGLERVERWKELIEKVCRLLRGDPGAAKAVASRRDVWQKIYEDSDADALASAICDYSPIEDVLLALSEAYFGLASSNSAQTIVELLACIVPVLHNQQLVYSLPQDPGGVLLQIPVSTPTIAEIVLAGVDGRAFRFRSLRDPKEFPAPAANVAGVPETGIDYEGKHTYHEFVDHLARKFVPAEDREILRRGGQTEQHLYEGLVSIVDDELAWQVKHAAEPLRYYFLFDSDFAGKHEKLLARIQRSLGNLQLVEMTGGDLAGERRLCRPLRELLYRSQEPSKEL